MLSHRNEAGDLKIRINFRQLSHIKAACILMNIIETDSVESIAVSSPDQAKHSLRELGSSHPAISHTIS
jgi:hypothetical protein